jgi:carboxymethylenebutenolidase
MGGFYYTAAEEESMDITRERVEIPVDGATMGGHLAGPAEGGPHPAVIVWMEIFGINAHIREVTERVAREGYVALAADFFHRSGPGLDLGYDDAGREEGFVHLRRLHADGMVADARAAVDWLRHREGARGDRIGCLGFCVGGHMAYLTACETDVAAVASFYGGGIAAEPTLARTEKIRGRILCLFGGEDEHIPSEQVDAIKAELTKHEIRNEVVVYPGAGHGFFCDRRDSYHEEAADDAWEKVKALFSDEIAG